MKLNSKIFYVLIIATTISCSDNKLKEKELELREREIALKEKEMKLKEQETTSQEKNKIESSDKDKYVPTIKSFIQKFENDYFSSIYKMDMKETKNERYFWDDEKTELMRVNLENISHPDTSLCYYLFRPYRESSPKHYGVYIGDLDCDSLLDGVIIFTHEGFGGGNAWNSFYAIYLNDGAKLNFIKLISGSGNFAKLNREVKKIENCKLYCTERKYGEEIEKKVAYSYSEVVKLN